MVWHLRTMHALINQSICKTFTSATHCNQFHLIALDSIDLWITNDNQRERMDPYNKSVCPEFDVYAMPVHHPLIRSSHHRFTFPNRILKPQSLCHLIINNPIAHVQLWYKGHCIHSTVRVSWIHSDAIMTWFNFASKLVNFFLVGSRMYLNRFEKWANFFSSF